jgi:hypothetical protein
VNIIRRDINNNEEGVMSNEKITRNNNDKEYEGISIV